MTAATDAYQSVISWQVMLTAQQRADAAHFVMRVSRACLCFVSYRLSRRSGRPVVLAR
jgi:hypothetical protein